MTLFTALPTADPHPTTHAHLHARIAELEAENTRLQEQIEAHEWGRVKC